MSERSQEAAMMSADVGSEDQSSPNLSERTHARAAKELRLAGRARMSGRFTVEALLLKIAGDDP